MSNTFFSGVLGVFAVMGGAAFAAECGGSYVVQRGDTLSLIAERHYDDAGLWTVIHNTNIGLIGESPNAVGLGMHLSLPCVNGLPLGLENNAPVAQTAPESLRVSVASVGAHARINLVTASDYAPFTDRDLPGGGLLTEVVDAAMRKANPAAGYAIHWVEAWDAHLDPLLSNALVDMGFPWVRPDCATTPQEYHCTNFAFSDPMFEMLTLLFTRRSDPIAFAQDSDVHGKVLCRPEGLSLHQMDRPDRRWLAQELVRLERPRAVADCFEMLISGEVDAVVLNEFTGRNAMKDLGLKAQVQIVQTRPLAIEGLHVLVHKSHPEADQLLETINAGLRGIKQDGTYQQIIDAHMTRIWDGF
ncbi:transporter substrate-binding domain-containing protein [Roseovarius sp. LXJ103]|uniref:transporter substrate-binding domain-containing protein n=1 Tax=Roseovarius carneus TaxID=2853164 RepID=UPI000D60CD03|nr:transporter substrate-binding domain-containing protein [Roseovarius carneus]MBZ8118585.1 transporter substrate-binding domain-containing protein [Roseovarius carneus]PWE35723.1 peptidoglycan-binding protein LysM [Pelagicola sp. LXJ1103]